MISAEIDFDGIGALFIKGQITAFIKTTQLEIKIFFARESQGYVGAEIQRKTIGVLRNWLRGGRGRSGSFQELQEAEEHFAPLRIELVN